MIYDWTLAKKCNDWVKLIQHGAEERHAGEEVEKSESEEDDDTEDCDDTQLIEVDDSASSASSQESFHIEDETSKYVLRVGDQYDGNIDPVEELAVSQL